MGRQEKDLHFVVDQTEKIKGAAGASELNSRHAETTPTRNLVEAFPLVHLHNQSYIIVGCASLPSKTKSNLKLNDLSFSMNIIVPYELPAAS